METKYDFEVSTDTLQFEITRLTNQLWKLIPMRENNENWEKQANTLILEIAGMNEVFEGKPQLLSLLDKLEGLLVISTSFEFYRKTVFECISLLQRLCKNDKS